MTLVPRRSWFAAVLALAVAPAVLSGVVQAEEKRMERTITVSATGTATAIPDLAHISTGVLVEAETARAALTRNSETMAKLIAGLKASGVDAKDIQTSSFNVEPRYTNPREGEVPVINGYRVNNQVQITSRNIDKLGEVLDQLVTLGANSMNGISFSVSEAEKRRDAARTEAVGNARRRAELYATAAGVKLGQVMVISEDSYNPGPQPYFKAARASMAEAVPIERGSQDLEARVTVTWALE